MSQDLHEDTSKEVAIAVLIEKVKNLEEDLNSANEQIQSLKKDKENALKYGVLILGSAVVSLISWIVEYFSTHVVNKLP